MSTIKHLLLPEEAQFLATDFAVLLKTNGTSFPVSGLKFDAATDWAAFWRFIAQNYGSGNLTVNINWYNNAAVTSGDVVFGAQIAAITPNTDSQDLETKALATANTVTDSHLGTTAKRLHRCTITISNLDSISADDEVYLRLYRDANAGGDTLAGDVVVTSVEVTYSDT